MADKEVKLVSMKGHEYSAPVSVVVGSKYIKDIIEQDPGMVDDTLRAAARAAASPCPLRMVEAFFPFPVFCFDAFLLGPSHDPSSRVRLCCACISACAALLC